MEAPLRALVEVQREVELAVRQVHHNSEAQQQAEELSSALDEAVISLAEAVNISLERYLERWSEGSRQTHALPLLTVLSPGEQVVVGVPHLTAFDDLTLQDEKPQLLRLPSSSFSCRSDEMRDDELTSLTECFVRGCVVSVSSTRGAQEVLVKLDIKKDRVVSVPPESVYSFKKVLTDLTSSASSSYQVGQVLLIESSSRPSVYDAVKLVEVEHQINQNTSSSNSAAQSSQKALKELTVQYKNHTIKRIIIGNDDPLHSCRRNENNEKNCTCDSLLILDYAWAVVNTPPLHALGFLLAQFPDFLVSLVEDKLAVSENNECPALLSAFNGIIHKKWQGTLQTVFYRVDRENRSYNEITQSVQNTLFKSFDSNASRGGGTMSRQSSTAPSCVLKEVISFTSSELERVHDTLFPPLADGSENRTEDVSLSRSGSCTPPLVKEKTVNVNATPTALSQLRMSKSNQNVNIIDSSTLSSKGDSYSIIACQDDFTYSNSTVMPFQFNDLPQDTCINVDDEKDGYEGLSENMELCHQIRHVCQLFDNIFILGISLLDSIHNHKYQNDFLFSTAEVEMRNLRDSHLAIWFNSCDDDDVDAAKSTMADYDNDDKAYFSDDNNDFCDNEGSLSRSRADSDESGQSMVRNRSQSKCPPVDKNIRRSRSNSSVPKLNFEEVKPDEDGNSVRQALMKDTDGSDALGGSSRLLKLLVSIGFMSSKYLQKIVSRLPPPYEVDVREWSATLDIVLNCRNSLITLISKIDLWHSSFSSTYQQQAQVLATFNNTLDPVEALLLQVAAEIHEVIPLKIDEAIAFASHNMDIMIVSNIWREEWDATSQYKKGQKVSLGVLHLVLFFRSMIHACIQSLSSHSNALRRLCASIITAAIRTILNCYNTLSPSRVRQGQIQKDLTAALASIGDTIKLLLAKGILPSVGSYDDSESKECKKKFSHLATLHQLQRSAFVTSSQQFLEAEPTYSNIKPNIEKYCLSMEHQQENDSSDHIPHMMSALHIEDYGFGDADKEFIGILKDSLLELIFLTHINISSSQSIVKLVSSSLSTDQDGSAHENNKRSRRSTQRRSGGLEMFDNYYNSTSDSVGYPEGLLVLKPLLQQSNVQLNSAVVEMSATTLSNILDCIIFPDSVSNESYDGSCLTDVIDKAAESFGNNLPYFDFGKEIRCCRGSSETKNGELICSVDKKFLSLIAVDVHYLLEILPKHRRELIDATYPPLTDEENETKEFLETFLASHESGMDALKSSIDASFREMESIVDVFPYNDEGARELCQSPKKINVTQLEMPNFLDLKFYWNEI